MVIICLKISIFWLEIYINFHFGLQFNMFGAYLRTFHQPNGPFSVHFLEKEVACLGTLGGPQVFRICVVVDRCCTSWNVMEIFHQLFFEETYGEPVIMCLISI